MAGAGLTSTFSFSWKVTQEGTVPSSFFSPLVPGVMLSCTSTVAQTEYSPRDLAAVVSGEAWVHCIGSWTCVERKP